MFPLLLACTNCSKQSTVAGDLSRHGADITSFTVMSRDTGILSYAQKYKHTYKQNGNIYQAPSPRHQLVHHEQQFVG